MYAIIEESGGQRKVTEGEEILIDLYSSGEADKGSSISFDKVLLIGDESDAITVTPVDITIEALEPDHRAQGNTHQHTPARAAEQGRQAAGSLFRRWGAQ